jgi:hypothetical protein
MYDVKRSKVSHARENLAGNSPYLTITLKTLVYRLKNKQTSGILTFNGCVNPDSESNLALTSRRVRLSGTETSTLIENI